MIDVICPNDGTTVLGKVESEEKVAQYLLMASCSVCGWHAEIKKRIPDITPRQAKQALILKGKNLNDVIVAINTLESPYKDLALVAWEYSISFERDYPLTEQIGLILGMSSDDLDDLWSYANTL